MSPIVVPSSLLTSAVFFTVSSSSTGPRTDTVRIRKTFVSGFTAAAMIEFGFFCADSSTALHSKTALDIRCTFFSFLPIPGG
ncbi:hypothetical protein [Leptospira johnsonii]|uniref:hypothetical protein n=1 Tax=Leptospira johnsonii TaxID=1917820 RepID=UPI00142E0C18|nr:hypothetical protein [Leptospira johnsonii]